MIDQTLAELLIARVVGEVEELHEQFIFAGGAITPLLLDDPGVREIRVTVDVDVIVEVLTRAEYQEIEEKLFARGFKNSLNGPICRYESEQSVIDVMDTCGIFGFVNSWFGEAVDFANSYQLRNGETIRLLSAPYFIACKLEAFRSSDRLNNNDVLASHDFEDIIAVVDGRTSICLEIQKSNAEVRSYIAAEFSKLRLSPTFEDGVYAHLPNDPASQKRIDLVLERIRSICDSKS